jgi:DNA-binding NtrC family response regulator
MSSDFTIFLIDDDPAILKALDRLLQAAGYETKAYLSAETFLSEHDPSIPRLRCARSSLAALERTTCAAGTDASGQQPTSNIL